MQMCDAGTIHYRRVNRSASWADVQNRTKQEEKAKVSCALLLSFPMACLCLVGVMSLSIIMLFIAYKKYISAAAAGTTELPVEPISNHGPLPSPNLTCWGLEGHGLVLT